MVRRFVERGLALASADGIRLLGLLLALVGSGLGFVLLADEILEQETQGFDEAVVRALRRAEDPSLPIGPDWLRQAALDVTALGGAPVLALITLAVCGFLALVRHYRSMLLVAGSTLGGAVLNAVLKAFFARPRPTVVPHLAEAYAPSFPSGHAMLSAIVYLTLGAMLAQLIERRRLKAYVLGVAVLLSFLVGLTRVFLGVHYLTDVLGGWMAGLAWALFTALLVRAVKRRSPALREEVRTGADEPEHTPSAGS
ncbi:MAG: phosphatase PAP2 family protein [Myxococcaceae bacterium]|nr:phosphatase PAP2 family protein [Myxococcaceae bacterium]